MSNEAVVGATTTASANDRREGGEIKDRQRSVCNSRVNVSEQNPKSNVIRDSVRTYLVRYRYRTATSSCRCGVVVKS